MLSFIVMFFCSISGFAQMLKGKVTDVQNQPLPGVTIVIKGTTNGTISDMDGNYSLKLNDPAKDVVVASFIGMESQDIPVGGKTVINIVMKDETTQLDEVVAVGYGTVKKRDITGSVASVKGDDLKAVPVSDAVQAMQGKLAGVQITSTEGSPDAEMTIKVRGGGSITQDNSPLFIVDGFPVSSLSDIPASDIESIDVLKDASSTAIYGSRGANGVIIVTTKSGKEGKTSVSYNAYYGVSKIAKELDVLDVPDYVNWQYEYTVLTDGEDDISDFTDYFGNYQDIDLYDGMKGNNWQDQIYGRTGNVFSHDVSIRGGGKKLTYSLSYANFKQKAIMILSDYDRNNINLKLQHKPNDKIKIDFSTRYSDTQVNGGGSIDTDGTTADARLKHAVVYTPIPLGDLSGTSDDEEVNSYMINPITSTEDSYREKRTKKYNVSGSFSWDITDMLTFKTDVGYDTYDYNQSRYYGLTAYYVNGGNATYQDQPAAKFTEKSREKIRNTNTLNIDFKKFFSSDHSMSLLLGHEVVQQKSNTTTSTIENYPEFFTSKQAFNLVSQGTCVGYTNDIAADDCLLSFFGRYNYSYKSKYMASATFRADGSSKFSEGNKWGYFPSLALAWRVSSESFMQGATGWLDDLKFRLSYGSAGNNNIPTGQTSSLYESQSTSSSIYINGVDNYLYVNSDDMPNPDLKWETTYTRNVGIDFALFRSKLNGSIEGYYNTTKDLLMESPVSGSGYTSQYQNVGETENTGVELSLNWVAVDKTNFGLNIGFNISMNQNNVVSLGDNEYINGNSGWISDITMDYKVLPGHAVGEMYGYRSDGRYEVSDFESYDSDNDEWILKEGVADDSEVINTALRPGVMKLKNLNGTDDDDDDTTNPTVTSDDREVIGNANPIATGGFNIGARIYNFDISAVCNFSYGNDVYNANKIEFTSETAKYPYRNLIGDMAEGKRWTNIDDAGNLVNDMDELASMNEKTTMWSPYMGSYLLSDWAVEDGSFLRLSTFTIGYSLPKVLLEKVKVEKLRFYVTGSNLFCLTGYSGMDPEVSTMRDVPYTPGVDYSAYPRARQVVFGLNLNF